MDGADLPSLAHVQANQCAAGRAMGHHTGHMVLQAAVAATARSMMMLQPAPVVPQHRAEGDGLMWPVVSPPVLLGCTWRAMHRPLAVAQDLLAVVRGVGGGGVRVA